MKLNISLLSAGLILLTANQAFAQIAPPPPAPFTIKAPAYNQDGSELFMKSGRSDTAATNNPGTKKGYPGQKTMEGIKTAILNKCKELHPNKECSVKGDTAPFEVKDGAWDPQSYKVTGNGQGATATIEIKVTDINKYCECKDSPPKEKIMAEEMALFDL